MFVIDTPFSTLLSLYSSPVMLWIFVIFMFCIFLAYHIRYNPDSKIVFLADYSYEWVYNFYESILWQNNAGWIKTYIVSLFFIILITNIFWVISDFIAPIFGVNGEWKFYLSEIFQIPSSDLHFNLALAILSVGVLLVTQFQSIGGKWFFTHYFPIAGKWYMKITKWSMKNIYFYLLFPLVKTFDILISLFLGFLDMIGLVAKVVSLSFRLFGNIISGGVLLTMMIVGLSKITEGFTQFLGGISFPIILPLALYAQGMLVAGIQAMVFALLVAIFIRVGQEV